MRRGTGQGDLIWDLMEKDEQWELFVESLWRFQYTKKSCAPTDQIDSSLEGSQSLSDVLYEETQGITDFAVKVYMFAQERAIDSRKEVVTAPIIRSAAKDKLRIPREVLQALKTKDKRVLEQYEDLYYEAFKSYLYQQSETVKVTGKVNSAPEIKVLLEQPSSTADIQADPIVSEKVNEVPRENRDSSKSTHKSNHKKPPTAVPAKGELPEIVAKVKAEGRMTVYEGLKHQGHIRSADEFLVDE